jgi:hypothetical protein
MRRLNLRSLERCGGKVSRLARGIMAADVSVHLLGCENML